MNNIIPDSQWQNAFDKLLGASSDRAFIIGRLGVKTSSSSADLAVPTRPGYYYVSTGLNGELGQSQARDGCGVAAVAWQTIWMVRENNELVICRATVYGGGSGGSGGASNLNALTDVTLSSPANGNTLQYNSATGQWVNVVPPGGAGGAPSPHFHSSVHHQGLLPWAELDKSSSQLNDIVTRPHSMITSIGANDHHNQQHVLATGTALGGDHTVSGANTGEVLRAIDGTHAAFDLLSHNELDPASIGPDQHHTRIHDIITGDTSPVHTIVGNQFQVVGATALNTLGLLTPTPAPGAAAAILRTDANGGIQLDTNLFYVDGANNRIGVNVVPGAGPLGAAAALDIRASSTADVTQRIRQLHGQNQRLWRVEDEFGNELIVMDSDGSLMSGHPLFVSGLTGWNITPEGNAEFNNIWARGELHATVFVKDEVHATGGTFMVATAGVLHDDAVIDSTAIDEDVLWIDSIPAGHGVPLQVQTTSGTFTGTELHVSFIGNLLNINDPPSGPAFYFQPGDIVRVKTEIANPIPPDTLRLADLWLEVNSAIQYDGYATYSVFKRSGSDCKIPKGTALVSYGKEGDGRILMTSDLQFAPYIDVFTTGTNVWLGAAGSTKERMRMGRLDGLKVPGVAGVVQYGMIAGQDLTDANQGYFIASDKQFSLYKINLRLNNGTNDTGLWTADGNLKLGSNVTQAATTGFQFDPGSGNVTIGDPTKTPANYLRWDQASGTLTVQGQLIVQDPGTTVTLAQVTSMDNQVRLDAGLSSSPPGYAYQAQTAAIAYGDARRIIGVSGTWTSPSTNQVSWASLAVVFASPVGSTRAIAAPAAPGYITIAARTYLYVSMAGSGTMTMTPTTSIAVVSAANNVLIAVCDPGDPLAPASARLASVTVVAGSTYISGGNIFTGSITASNIASRTITADRIRGSELTMFEMGSDVTGAISSSQTNAQAYSDGYRILGVTGTWTSTAGNVVGWVSLQIKFGNGSTRNISGNANYTLTRPNPPNEARHYLFVDYSLQPTGTMTMQDNTSLAAITPTCVLIAIADTGPDKVSVNVVAGSTYIGGGNIFAQSVNAGNIVSNSITVSQMHPAYTQTITDAKTAADNAGTAASNAQIYGDRYKLQAVRGSITVTGQRSITWSSVILYYAGDAGGSGTTGYSLTNGSLTGLSTTARSYIYYNPGETTLHATTTLAELTATNSLVAVFDPGATTADPGSLSIVGGATYISGNNIVTGSIIAANIQGAAVTANKINVDGNIDIAGSGALTVGTAGSIHSSGKSYGSNGTNGGTGYFLGFNGIAPVFSLGSASQFLLWDGSTLAVAASSLALSGSGTNMLSFSAPSLSATLGLVTNSLTGSGSALYVTPTLEVQTSVKATRFSATASMDTPTLMTPDLVLNDPTFAGPQVSNMIQFTYNTLTHYLGYDKGGILSYDGTMTAATSFSAPTLIASGNHISIIQLNGGINNSSAAGNVGDIAWSDGFLYVHNSSGWRRIPLGNAF